MRDSLFGLLLLNAVSVQIRLRPRYLLHVSQSVLDLNIISVECAQSHITSESLTMTSIKAVQAVGGGSGASRAGSQNVGLHSRQRRHSLGRGVLGKEAPYTYRAFLVPVWHRYDLSLLIRTTHPPRYGIVRSLALIIGKTRSSHLPPRTISELQSLAHSRHHFNQVTSNLQRPGCNTRLRDAHVYDGSSMHPRHLQASGCVKRTFEVKGGGEYY